MFSKRLNVSRSDCQLKQSQFFCRDPYIVRLNIAFSMVVSLSFVFGGKNHISNGQHVSVQEPCFGAARRGTGECTVAPAGGRTLEIRV